MSSHAAVAIPAPGFEDVCAAEVKDILGISATASVGSVSFTVDDLLKLAEYCYRAHTPSRVMLELLAFKTPEQLKKALTEKKVLESVKAWIPDGKTFVVRCHSDSDAVDRQVLEAEVGEIIHEHLHAKVDLKQPDVTLLVLAVGKTRVFGIDFSGDDLGRRDYRIFLGPEALKGHIAASLVLLSGYRGKGVFLDLFCRSGVIPIEAALLVTKQSPHKFGKEKFLFRTLPALAPTDWEPFFEKLDTLAKPDAGTTIIAMDPSFNSISAAKKNAKIAGIIKDVTFSRTDLQFLDAKFGKRAIDYLVTLPPQVSVNLPAARMAAMLKDIFYQAEFVMKPGGTCVLITRTGTDILKEHAKEYGFTLARERAVKQGSADLIVLEFKK